jgi:hypothetical protein
VSPHPCVGHTRSPQAPEYDAFGAFADGLPAWDAPSRMATSAGHGDANDAPPAPELLAAQLSAAGGGDTGKFVRRFNGL